MPKIDSLRKTYPQFIYKSFKYRFEGGSLHCEFHFIVKNIQFHPTVVIHNVTQKEIERVTEQTLNNLVFNLGLIEIPSYWKATCSPEIIIEAEYLSKEQIKWWHNFFIKGMSQFYYENKINFLKPNFLTIISRPKSASFLGPTKESLVGPRIIGLAEKTLVPIGGGKDSIVTLEKLKEQKKEIACFLVNPTNAAKNIAKVAGIKNSIVVTRTIDPTLLELNKKGFLNGHTPITAVVSFISVLCAALFGCKFIAFSNEKSANEPNTTYLGKPVNHQWSKSAQFETMFKTYCKKYLLSSIEYFSFLRPYSEFQIVKMFLNYPQYFSVFSSCNVAVAKKLKQRWCGNCPKCLFVYAMLYPFLSSEQLLTIFGTDIFENKTLLPVVQALIAPNAIKPLECVGTKKESQKAFTLSLAKAKKTNHMPYLLSKLMVK